MSNKPHYAVHHTGAVIFDLDGVLVDFPRGFCGLAAILGRPIPGTTPYRWNDYSDPIVWEAIRESPDFWLELEPLISSTTADRINRLVHTRPVYFATSRVGKMVLQQSMLWIERRLNYVAPVVVTDRKAELCRVVDAEWLLEDNAMNCAYASLHSPETTVCLLDYPHNRTVDWDTCGARFQRVASVDEFLDLVEKMR